MGWRSRQIENERSAWGVYPPYVSVAERRKRAAKDIAVLKKEWKSVAPVVIEGRAIATTFWGKAWCQNLEHYSDYESRLPKGRTYVRSGAVIDLQIDKGKVSALVRGTELYTVSITVKPVEPALWKAIVSECSGKIDSVIELLRGKLSGAVMEVITRPQTGLFPSPKQIQMKCTCPDWATLCKHAAAALYGVGARLDRGPDLIFLLRGVDPAQLVGSATASAITGKQKVAKEKMLSGDLASVFGIDLDTGSGPSSGVRAKPKVQATSKERSPRVQRKKERSKEGTK